jgi:hypothetical protein
VPQRRQQGPKNQSEAAVFWSLWLALLEIFVPLFDSTNNMIGLCLI